MKRAPVILMGIAAAGIGAYIAFSDVGRPQPRTAPTARSVGDRPERSGDRPADVAGDRAERSSDESAALARETAALRARMARLDAELSALREQVGEDRAPANTDTSAANPEPAPRDPAVIAEQAREWRAHMTEVDANFQREARDPRWASSTASALQSGLHASDTMRDKVRSVECRSQTCRVEITDDGSGAMAKDLPMFVHQLAETLPSMQADQIDDGNGNRTVVLYLSRDDGASAVAAEKPGR